MDEVASTTPKSAMNRYLDAVYQGKNDWWRYVFGVSIILFMWLVIGSVPVAIYAIYLMADGNPATELTIMGFLGVNPLVSFLIIIVSFIPLFIGIFIVVRFVHDRPLRSLITPGKQINWKRIAIGFLTWFILLGIISIYEAIMYPGRYNLTLDIGAFIPFALFAILLLPIQTSSEELFFRGYLMQWMGLKYRNLFFLPIFTGLIFMALHFGNPEMVVTSGSLVMAASYFVIGAFMALVTLLDGGLELALGLHAANNIYTALIANYTISALPSSSFFVINEIDPTFGLVSLLIALGVFYLLMFVIFPRTHEQVSVSQDKEVL
jgi:uncharacterized protein